MKAGGPQETCARDLKEGRYALQSLPAVFGDIVITGCSNGEKWPSA